MPENNPSQRVQLLDDEGDITHKFEQCLYHIFSQYCTPASDARPAILDEAGLDRWAIDTNGTPFTRETKEELWEFIDTDDEGGLTFKGFLQIYALQTENDEEETWKDLAKHGFDRQLNLVTL